MMLSQRFHSGFSVLVIASEAKQSILPQSEEWIASSLTLLAMTENNTSITYEDARQKEGPREAGLETID
jgi:hypothetical protein